ncbi:hypothetical protein [Candidatus Villigracilis affinis]|uniref:alpha/beta hydrolase family protein n=1 Tax=Candidatus Villigracilis affinis TaxID=3140682 RepID=UPI001E009362|nr:hypothetical protein [Anaerolineales bacterium]
MTTKISIFRVFSMLFIFMFLLTQFAGVSAAPALSDSVVLTPGRAIATWPSGVPAGEKRPVVVFLPGWGGSGSVDAAVSAQNMNLVNQGYVTLAIGFNSPSDWISDIDVQTADGLDKLCADASIPANCDAIILDGSSYGGAQNYYVIEYIRSNGYDGKALGFVSEDAGYAAPGNLIDPVTGDFQRTGLADTASYGIAMIENLGDSTFPVDDCTWGNCGARTLSDAHQAQGDTNVFSICPPGGEHGTRGYADWDAWVISSIKTLFHSVYGVPTFTGYTGPTISVGNTCVSSGGSSTFTDVPTTHPLYKYIQALYDAGYTAGCSSSPMMFCPDTIFGSCAIRRLHAARTNGIWLYPARSHRHLWRQLDWFRMGATMGRRHVSGRPDHRLPEQSVAVLPRESTSACGGQHLWSAHEIWCGLYPSRREWNFVCGFPA